MGAGDAVVRGNRDVLAELVRDEGTRVLATLVRVTGNIDLAQDAAQDAILRALETWPRDGVPDNPRAWLLVTAKRRAIDVIRRETRRAGKEAEAMMFIDPEPEPAEVVQRRSAPARLHLLPSVPWRWRRRSRSRCGRSGACRQWRSPAV